jgi:hypothetical protein
VGRLARYSVFFTAWPVARKRSSGMRCAAADEVRTSDLWRRCRRSPLRAGGWVAGSKPEPSARTRRRSRPGCRGDGCRACGASGCAGSLPQIQPTVAHRVYNGMIPCRHSHSTISGVLWPARLFQTSNSRSGGRAADKNETHPRPLLPRAHRAWFRDRRHARPAGDFVRRLRLQNNRQLTKSRRDAFRELADVEIAALETAVRMAMAASIPHIGSGR